MDNKKVFNTDQFLKKATIYAICFICFIGSFMIIYSKLHNRSYNGFTGYFSIMEEDEAAILRQIGIIDPLANNNKVKLKNVREEVMIKACMDDILNGLEAEYFSFSKSTLSLKLQLMFDKKIKNLPSKIEYYGLECLGNDNMYVCSRVSPLEDVGHYVFSSDVFTMNGRDITFTTTILYYQIKDKYYTDSTLSTLICEGEVSCVYSNDNYQPKDIIADYYVNGNDFLLKEINAY